MSGQLRAVLKKPNVPSPASNQPTGTEGRYEEYWDGENKVAGAHYFWLPPGHSWRIGGASGVPEPKWVMWEGAMLIAED